MPGILAQTRGIPRADPPSGAIDVALCLASEAGHRPAPGSNTMLTASLETAHGLEVIISDVLVPPDSSVPPHSHPGEEFVYVIEGEAVTKKARRIAFTAEERLS